MTAGDQILAHLLRGAAAARDESILTDDAVRIRGAWNTSYAIELAHTSSRLHLHYVVIQTIAQGCCYYEPAIEAPGLSDALLGVDAVATDLGGGAWQIAALDAVYGQLCRAPDERIALEGSNIHKAGARAEIVQKEVERLIDRTARPRAQAKVANVGVVGDFLAILKQRTNVTLTASDYYQRIVGREVSGVTIHHGSMTAHLVADADVAIVTGMTLATGTLDEILAVARESGTAIILFAQTGAHFAEVYLELGATTVLAEPLPFYLSGDGVSMIDIFRAPERG
jgi:hypothetical protein